VTRFSGGPAQSPGFLLWHLTLRWQRAIAAALAPFDLTHVQFVLLACTYWLTEQGHRPNQQQVAAQAGTDVKMTSQVLRRLEAHGLIARRTDEGDTRAKTLSMTRRGRALAIQTITVVEDADAAFFAEYPAALTRVLIQAAAPGKIAGDAGPSRGSRRR
jgi:DNA-binding MarR family transcriptional regulator